MQLSAALATATAAAPTPATTPTTARSRSRTQHGATLIEFALVLLFGLLPLVLAILQIVALLVARNTVNLATFMAARQGAVMQAAPEAMRRELARGLLPLYVPAARDGRVPAATALRGYAAALADVQVLDSLQVITPTKAAATAVALLRGGVRVVPNDAIESRPLAVQEANVLTLGVIHCQPVVVPFVGPALAATLALLDTDLRHQRCYAATRVPLLARASVVMQSDLPIAVLD